MSTTDTKPQHSTIHQQDDYELLQHIETSWASIQATIDELRKRRICAVLMLGSQEVWPSDIVDIDTSWRMVSVP